MRKLTFDLEVVTPLFLGGANQQAELRAPTFKHLGRWWFRAVKGAHTGL
jgi:CRISPR-associated protein Cmr1